MPSVQMPLTGDNAVNARHLNRGLFSDYYLDRIIPTTDEWPPLYAEAKRIHAQLRAQLEGLRLEALDEAQLENQWIQPVLKAIGHFYSVQVKIRYRDKGN